MKYALSTETPVGLLTLVEEDGALIRVCFGAYEGEAVHAETELLLQAQGCSTLTLSADACARCDACTYPDSPCRHPNLQTPCLEGYGIVVSDLAERCGVPFPPEMNLVYWYACILFSGKD